MLRHSVARVALALSITLFLSTTVVRAEVPLTTLVHEHDAVQEDLKRVASGLDSTFKRDPVAAAEQLFALARHTTALIQELGNTTARTPDLQARGILLEEATATLRRVIQFQEYVQGTAITMVRQIQPGEPLQELWTREGKDLMRPLFRTDTPRPGEPKPNARNKTRELTTEFTSGGGNLNLVQILSRNFLQTVPSGELFTWVQFGQVVRVYPGDIKHVILAEGRSVRGAGNGKVIRSKSGEILLVLWSNSSGNYKPGVGSLEGPVAETIDLGVPASRVIATTSYPIDAGIIKLLGRLSRGVSKEQVPQFLADVQNRTAPELFTGASSLERIPEVTPTEAWRAHFGLKRAAHTAQHPTNRTTARRIRGNTRRAR